MKGAFYIEDLITQKKESQFNDDVSNINKQIKNKKERFEKLCKEISKHFDDEWKIEIGKGNEASEKLLDQQRKAIIGEQQEVSYFKSKIEEYLKEHNLKNEWFPNWYTDIISAVFHENWGLAGIEAWMRLGHSSSAKIIGERIFFFINGQQILQEQRISRERLDKLKRALLLKTPEEQSSKPYNNVYMLDGTRITIFNNSIAKEPVIIFRKYIVEKFTFEEQAKRGTIPDEVIPMFKSMIKIGYNVNFIGPVRSGKTTFLETWQSYEDPTLEGIQVETDPEIPLHILMPNAPIMQIVADGEELENIIKPLMRGDGNYIIMAEARDPVALYIAVEVTKKGIRRVKSTFHTNNATNFVYNAANEIVRKFGGDVWANTIQVAEAYHYLFHFTELKSDKSKKRLKGVYEVRFDAEELKITIHQIMKYDFIKDDWTYKYDVGEDKKEIAYEEDYEAFEIFEKELQKLAEQKPMQGKHITVPNIMRLMKC